MVRIHSTLIALGLAVVASACGDNPTAPSKPQPQTLTFNQTVSGFGYYLQDVNVFQYAGQLEARLSWSNGSKDLDLYWTNAFCTIGEEGFTGTGCLIVNQSVSPAGTSEIVVGPVAASSVARLFVVNFATSPEDFTLRVTLTPN